MSQKKKRKAMMIKTDGNVFFDDFVTQIQDNNIDFVNREIYLVGEIDSTEMNESLKRRRNERKFGGTEPGVEFIMASRFIKNIRTLDVMNHEPILVHMKTCGGYWEEGMAIHNAIEYCKSKVTILSYTHARSMSSLIFQAADKRVMMPHSYFLYHYGTEALWGIKQEVESNFKWNKTLNDKMLEVYAFKMREEGTFKGKSKKVIKDFLKEQIKQEIDVFLTPSQTIKLGLADEVFDGNWDGLRRYPRKPKPEVKVVKKVAKKKRK